MSGNYWLKNLKEAFGNYARAISLNPACATAYTGRAIEYLSGEENQNTLKNLKKVKELNLDGVYPNLNKLFADNKQGFLGLVLV